MAAIAIQNQNLKTLGNRLSFGFRAPTVFSEILINSNLLHLSFRYGVTSQNQQQLTVVAKIQPFAPVIQVTPRLKRAAWQAILKKYYGGPSTSTGTVHDRRQSAPQISRITTSIFQIPITSAFLFRSRRFFVRLPRLPFRPLHRLNHWTRPLSVKLNMSI